MFNIWRSPAPQSIAILMAVTPLLGCSLELIGNQSNNGTDNSDDSEAIPVYLRAGTLEPVTMPNFSVSDTHKISELYQNNTPISGKCSTGSSVYVIDANDDSVLGNVNCLADAFTLNVDFSAYPDGPVPVKITQVIDDDSSSDFFSLTYSKQTVDCAGVNDGAFPAGSGTAMDPYLICSAEQLSNFFDVPRNAAHFHLKNDIDVSSEPTLKGRFPSGNAFDGTLNGNHFSIYNYSANQALILAVSSNGNIQNLKLRDMNVTLAVASRVAVLVNHFYGNTFSDVSATGTVVIPDLNTFDSSGILIGLSNRSISNSWVNADVTIAAQSTIHKFGMIVGRLDGGTTMNNCHAYGSITSPNAGSLILGGLIGGTGNHWSAAAHTITQSYANLNMTGGKYAGGLVGENGSGTALFVDESYYMGDLHSDHGTGGIVGMAFTPFSISKSYALGDFIQAGQCIGGLAGAAPDNSTISESFFRGSVRSNDSSGWSGVGGLVGCTNDSIIVEDSYAIATVEGSGFHAGLLGGWNITNSKISTSFFQGTVAGGDAISDDAAPTLNAIYYDGGMASSIQGDALALTSDQFSDSSQFLGFSFGGSPWVMLMGGTYPQLYIEQ